MRIFFVTFVRGFGGCFVRVRIFFCIGGTEVFFVLRGSLESNLGSCELRDRPSGTGSDISV